MNNFSINLCNILTKIKCASTAEDIFERSVQERLNKSLDTYYKSLISVTNSALNEDGRQILRELSD